MILRNLTASTLALVLLTGSVAAQDGQPADAATGAAPADVVALYEAMGLPEIIDVMALEGVEYGGTLAESLFPNGPVPAEFDERVVEIYDVADMREAVLASLTDDLADANVAAMLEFVEAEPGRTLVDLEVSARAAMLDEEVEEAAKEAAAVAIADDDPRVELIRRYAEVNDLIETNVVSAMNSNYAYFMGMMDGGALARDMTEGDVLADVWAQEPQIRADTSEWVMSFLLMAYGPASDADLEALIDFSATPDGQVLNRAVFMAFDGLFEDISHDLGLASARYMTTQEL